MIDQRLDVLELAVFDPRTDTAELWRGALEVLRQVEAEGVAPDSESYVEWLGRLKAFASWMWKKKRCAVPEARPFLAALCPHMDGAWKPAVAVAATSSRARWSCGHGRQDNDKDHCHVCAVFGRRTTI